MTEISVDNIRRIWPGVRAKNKLAFLAAYRINANVTQAASAAGIHRTTMYVWQEHDEAFAQAFRVADEMATDALEAEAWRRAVEGVVKETPIIHNGEVVSTVVETKYSDGLISLLLKARRREKYGDKIDLTQTQVVKAIDATAWDAV